MEVCVGGLGGGVGGDKTKLDKILTCTPPQLIWPHRCSGKISPREQVQRSEVMLDTRAYRKKKVTTLLWHSFLCANRKLMALILAHFHSFIFHPRSKCAWKLTDLKELHADTGEHELEQGCDDHDVPDGPDGHEHTLDHVLPRPKDPTVRYKLSLQCTGRKRLYFFVLEPWTSTHTLSPLALLMALRGLNTLSTRRIFTTEIAEDLHHTNIMHSHAPDVGKTLL